MHTSRWYYVKLVIFFKIVLLYLIGVYLEWVYVPPLECLLMGFQENLKKCRESKGWTQSQAAEAAGVSFRSYQNWEIGGREPRLDALRKLADAFGVSADNLLADHGGKTEKPAAKKKGGRK